MKKYLVIGNPIEHSLSPKLHNHWIKQNNIDAVYEKKQLNENDITAMIDEVKSEKINGINVTVPFKKSVIPFLDQLTLIAKEAQSVNTIFKKDNKIVGDNTDIGGFEYGLKHINYNVQNKKVAVIGSQTPWIEAMLINRNNDVTTVEYNVSTTFFEKLTLVDYFDSFEKSEEEYDCIVTFSSVEHSGLGRYGDPLDPNGDIKTMKSIHRNLKTNGILIWGAPVGKDALVWNAHRIYGEIRLPLIFENFKELEWLGGSKNELFSLPLTKDPIKQPVIALEKKTTNNYYKM